MAAGQNEGIRMLDPLVCDAIPGAPESKPAPENGAISAVEFDAHHQAMTVSELLEQFYRLIHAWRTGRGDDNVLRALSSIRKVLQGRGKDPGPCEEHGDPERYGRW